MLWLTFLFARCVERSRDRNSPGCRSALAGFADAGRTGARGCATAHQKSGWPLEHHAGPEVPSTGGLVLVRPAMIGCWLSSTLLMSGCV